MVELLPPQVLVALAGALLCVLLLHHLYVLSRAVSALELATFFLYNLCTGPRQGRVLRKKAK